MNQIGRIAAASMWLIGICHAGTITGTIPSIITNSNTLVSVAAASRTALQDSITYTDTFLLTVTGGSGDGFFEPLAHVSNTFYRTESSIAFFQLTATCGDVLCGGSLSTDYNSSQKSWFAFEGGAFPFTYGVPITITITMGASDCCALGIFDPPLPLGGCCVVSSEADFNGFAVYDPRTRQSGSGIFTVSRIDGDSSIDQAPEPGSLWLMFAALAGLIMFSKSALLRTL
jgi:hypothetical protein